MELEKQNKQFYTRVQEKNGKCTVRSEVFFFGNQEIDEFEIKKKNNKEEYLIKALSEEITCQDKENNRFSFFFEEMREVIREEI